MSQQLPDDGYIEEAPLVHPALRPKRPNKEVSKKQRRTTVRTIKLVNPHNEEPALVQVPIEPSFNNRGSLKDPTTPIRHYLDKGFVFPHEYDPEKWPDIFCAVKDCWDPAMVNTDHENGSERCLEHELMYRQGIIRYPTAAREPSLT
jgi:hypothetical protein